MESDPKPTLIGLALGMICKVLIAQGTVKSLQAIPKSFRSKNGVIVAKVSLVEPTLVGLPVAVLVEVHIDRVHIEPLKEVKARLSGPEIQQRYHVAREADFLLVVTVATMEDDAELAHWPFYPDSNADWLRSTVVKDRVKTTLNLPMGVDWHELRFRGRGWFDLSAAPNLRPVDFERSGRRRGRCVSFRQGVP